MKKTMKSMTAIRNTKSKKSIGLLIGVWLCLFFMAAVILLPDDAHALRVTLKRIIFEESKRTETLTVVNNTANEQTFRMSWKHLKMTEDRSLTPVEEGEVVEGLKFADDMIRYAPRRITLAPGATQQVRLMLRRPRDLEEGEYRSHFWIFPEAEAGEFEGGGEAGEGGQAIKLAMLAGISLPVFVRHGQMEVSGKISDAAIKKEEDHYKAELILHREGNRSLYGDFDFICTGDGEDKVLHQIRGVAVYTEVNKRYLDFKLPDPAENVGPCPKLRMIYKADNADSLFDGQIISEATVPFPGQ